MDTISIKLNFKKNINISLTEATEMRKKMDKFRSPYGFTYVDSNKNITTERIIVKLSYPRFFKDSNAYIVNSSKECLELHAKFIDTLYQYGYLKFFENIELIRVDIPFTYIRNKDEDFNSYYKVFKLMDRIYRNDIPGNKSTTAVVNLTEDKLETVYFTDTKIMGNYNSHVVIYDQNLNLYNKYLDRNETYRYDNILKEFPDLPHRMRIEVSKRIRRKPFTIEEFYKYDILNDYFENFRIFLIDNFLDRETFNKVIDKNSDEIMDIIKDQANKGIKPKDAVLNSMNKVLCFDSVKLAFRKMYGRGFKTDVYTNRFKKYIGIQEESNGYLIINAVKRIDDIRHEIYNRITE